MDPSGESAEKESVTWFGVDDAEEFTFGNSPGDDEDASMQKQMVRSLSQLALHDEAQWRQH